MFRSPYSIAMFVLCFATLACASTSAHALQTYCVSTVSQLRIALDQAESDGDDSRINMRSGTYNFSSELLYATALEYTVLAGSLTIEGGYDANCASNVDDSRLTVVKSIIGEGFKLATETGTVVLKTLTFDDTDVEYSGNLSTSGRDFCTSSDLKFEGRRLRAIDARLTTRGRCHDIILRDSLFAGGSNASSLWIYLDQDDALGAPKLIMVNNTVADDDTYILSSGDRVGSAFLYNNIFRGNNGPEIIAQSTNVFAYNNRWDNLWFSASSPLAAGILDPSSSNNLASEPGIDSDYRPNPGSPMMNSGTALVPGGLLTVDVYGDPRVVGAGVDRGAVEAPAFTSTAYTVTNNQTSGPGSLSNAITLANNHPGFDDIKFNIPGNCPVRIPLPSTLFLRDPVRLDGWSQSGSVRNSQYPQWKAITCITLDGMWTPSSGIATGSQLGTGSVTIRGLAFERFTTAIALNYGDGARIHGNQFGGDAGGHFGPTLLGNRTAIAIAGSARNSVIGGDEDEQSNLISDSSVSGVSVELGSIGNQVVNNRIGIGDFYNTPVPNRDGINISTADNIVRSNIVSRNSRDGVVLTGANATGNVVTNNIIGGVARANAQNTLGNMRHGVTIDSGAHDNTVSGNTITVNGEAGIRITAAAGGHNRLSSNTFDRNTAPGIDLGIAGVTTNDSDPVFCNPATGCAANRGQNFPRLTEVLRMRTGSFPAGEPIRITGLLTSTVAALPYRIEFFASATCHATANGEGTRYIGFAEVLVANAGLCTDSNCTAAFTAYMPVRNVSIDDVVTATATSPDGDTSEFSQCTAASDQDRIFANGFQ